MLKPLAFRMRPRVIEDIIGQEHLVGNGKIIHRMVQARRLSSMILYGPPGVGKTSMASAIAGSANLPFKVLNAATDSKKDIELIIEETKISGTIILLMDEIHRLNKTKQDFLLPYLEKGTLILIGATTENPFIAINPAIRSRTQIFELKPLSADDIKRGITKTLTNTQNGLGQYNITLQDDALTHLSTATNGDFRSALNALELAVLSTPKTNDTIVVTLESISECLQKKFYTHDKNGDAHYDTLSAFQKSIRGSDVDAALHYLARLIEADDLTSIARRLLVIAYEDIGLANPNAVDRTLNAVQVAEKIGFPEARIPLAHAVIDLSLSPKSNSCVVAIDHALQALRSGSVLAIPDHLKDTHYVGAKTLHNNAHYLYPHDYDNHWVYQQYLPNSIINDRYYTPNYTGKYEQALAQQYKKYNNKPK